MEEQINDTKKKMLKENKSSENLVKKKKTKKNDCLTSRRVRNSRK